MPKECVNQDHGSSDRYIIKEKDTVWQWDKHAGVRATIVEAGWQCGAQNGSIIELIRPMPFDAVFFLPETASIWRSIFGSLFPVCSLGIITRTYVLAKCGGRLQVGKLQVSSPLSFFAKP
jgi:hypothetical protein